MKPENRKKLRDNLVGRTIKDVVFHDSHGLVVDIVLDDDSTFVICRYDSSHEKLHPLDDFYVGLNLEEL